MNSVLLKVNNSEFQQKYNSKHLKLFQNIYRLILPHVKKVFRQSDALGGLSDIASTLCLFATGKDSLPTFDDLFKYFTETMCCDAKLVKALKARMKLWISLI